MPVKWSQNMKIAVSAVSIGVFAFMFARIFDAANLASAACYLYPMYLSRTLSPPIFAKQKLIPSGTHFTVGREGPISPTRSFYSLKPGAASYPFHAALYRLFYRNAFYLYQAPVLPWQNRGH